MYSAPLTGQGLTAPPEAKPVNPAAGPPKPPASPPRRPPRVVESSVQQPQPQMPAVPFPQTPMMPGMAFTNQALALTPAMQSMLLQTLNSQRTVGQKFIMMVLFDDAWPKYEEFDDVQQLVRRIKELLGKPCALSVFLGCRLHITQGPNRYLQTPFGPIPLFDLPDGNAVGVQDFGWVGPEMNTPQPPTTDTEERLLAEEDVEEFEEEPPEPIVEEPVVTDATTTDSPVF